MCQIRGEEQRPTQAFLIIKVVKRGVVDRAEKELWEKVKEKSGGSDARGVDNSKKEVLGSRIKCSVDKV